MRIHGGKALELDTAEIELKRRIEEKRGDDGWRVVGGGWVLGGR